MTSIMDHAGVNYTFLDKDTSVCCGRPMVLSGKKKQAEEMMEYNRQLILKSKARVLVTSCPICHRIFKEEYHLPIRVIHHSQFILELVKHGRLPLQSYHRSVVYHDPCELGRHAGVYLEPRELLGKVADVIPSSKEKEDALCCGGSLGTFTASNDDRARITKNALDHLLVNKPDYLVTSCPACKKTFAQFSDVPVLDLAEVIRSAIPEKSSLPAEHVLS
jgi:Fe-S oxidoreductase